MTRRFAAGQSSRIDGLDYRVVRGDKLRRTDQMPGLDLRLDVWTPTGWSPVSMRAGAMMADFYFENEAQLWPPPYRGGQMYVDHLQRALDVGWQQASAELDQLRNGSTLQRDQHRPSG